MEGKQSINAISSEQLQQDRGLGHSRGSRRGFVSRRGFAHAAVFGDTSSTRGNSKYGNCGNSLTNHKICPALVDTVTNEIILRKNVVYGFPKKVNM
jgi:hypothetical protein